MKPKKDFDCVEMKNRAQEAVREELRGKTQEEEIAYFRAIGAELEKRIEAAKKADAHDVAMHATDAKT
jgi:hypothetical protein